MGYRLMGWQFTSSLACLLETKLKFTDHEYPISSRKYNIGGGVNGNV